MKLFGSKTSAPDLPSNKLPCPCFPPIPQMDPLSHQVLGFQPTVCFAKSIGCAWAVGGTCAVYRIGEGLALLKDILQALRRWLPAVPEPGSETPPVESKPDDAPDEPPVSVQGPSQGNA